MLDDSKIKKNSLLYWLYRETGQFPLRLILLMTSFFWLVCEQGGRNLPPLIFFDLEVLTGVTKSITEKPYFTFNRNPILWCQNRKWSSILFLTTRVFYVFDVLDAFHTRFKISIVLFFGHVILKPIKLQNLPGLTNTWEKQYKTAGKNRG